jgi:hypothetical protein
MIITVYKFITTLDGPYNSDFISEIKKMKNLECEYNSYQQVWVTANVDSSRMIDIAKKCYEQVSIINKSDDFMASYRAVGKFALDKDKYENEIRDAGISEFQKKGSNPYDLLRFLYQLGGGEEDDLY